MSNSSFLPIDRTLSGVTTPDQSGPGSDGNEGVHCIPQSFSITGTSPSDCLMSYPGHSLDVPKLSPQGPILALVNPWSTNTKQNEEKDKIDAFVHARIFNLLFT